MNTAARILAPLFLLSFLMSSCHMAQKYVESGDYDSAIDLCVSRLRGKAKKNPELVQALELAYRKAQARDLNAVESMSNSGRSNVWDAVYDLELKINARQNKVKPLTPLVAKNGYRAQFEFVDMAPLMYKSRENACEYWYELSLDQLEKAEKGDKMAARQAHRNLSFVMSKYNANYRNIQDQLARARDLGTSYVVFEVKNQSGKILPSDFSERLMAMSKQDLDSEWKDYSFEAKPGLQYDYKAVLKVHSIDVSPERIQERSYFDEKRIQDGWDYVLDMKGNVKKDSTGKDIKTPRMVWIRAEVLEVHQTKAARIGGAVEVRDLRTNQLLESCEVSTEVVFENYASTFRGDERALSQDSKSRIGNRPLPFPLDADMLVQAADRLKPDVREELRRSRAIL